MSESTRRDIVNHLRKHPDVPVWACSVYGRGEYIVASNGYPGAETRSAHIGHIEGKNWEPTGTVIACSEGIIDFEKATSDRNTILVQVTGLNSSGKTTVQRIIAEALQAHGFEVELTPRAKQEVLDSPKRLGANIPLVAGKSTILMDEQQVNDRVPGLRMMVPANNK